MLCGDLLSGRKHATRRKRRTNRAGRTLAYSARRSGGAVVARPEIFPENDRRKTENYETDRGRDTRAVAIRAGPENGALITRPNLLGLSLFDGISLRVPDDGYFDGFARAIVPGDVRGRRIRSVFARYVTIDPPPRPRKKSGRKPYERWSL